MQVVVVIIFSLVQRTRAQQQESLRFIQISKIVRTVPKFLQIRGAGPITAIFVIPHPPPRQNPF